MGLNEKLRELTSVEGKPVRTRVVLTVGQETNVNHDQVGTVQIVNLRPTDITLMVRDSALEGRRKREERNISLHVSSQTGLQSIHPHVELVIQPGTSTAIDVEQRPRNIRERKEYIY